MKPTIFFSAVLIWYFFLNTISSNGQIIRAGIKAGTQLSWIVQDDEKHLDVVDIHSVVGFNAGAVLAFKVKDRYFLHTEYIYSRKGKSVSGKIDPVLSDKTIYHHLDIPILFTLHFKAKLGKERHFKWYLGAGPNASYWLGGKGQITSGELKENGLDYLDYKIAFGKRPDHTRPDLMYIEHARRLQFGMNFGGGILLEPGGKQMIMVDLRYEVGHTRIGKSTGADFIIPTDYDDNLRARNKGLRLSLIYLFETNLDPKQRNKGKSTIKR